MKKEGRARPAGQLDTSIGATLLASIALGSLFRMAELLTILVVPPRSFVDLRALIFGVLVFRPSSTGHARRPRSAWGCRRNRRRPGGRSALADAAARAGRRVPAERRDPVRRRSATESGSPEPLRWYRRLVARRQALRVRSYHANAPARRVFPSDAACLAIVSAGTTRRRRSPSLKGVWSRASGWPQTIASAF